ncbi:hypothetical protein GPECTOR_61g779 [Gonium pectorale]|uniref:Uncharacterized protein n=1 Tax=Gonium pectorale TaxID=33097 RepID=A0A150G4L9_GONPE|nr:hypothetical protein GPECTOR_61g779 [Gonium pectorale]|eukprot:KXZ44826.1 hypothetical protein GPECTOR_61g779 [Gonium pectorale]
MAVRGTATGAAAGGPAGARSLKAAAGTGGVKGGATAKSTATAKGSAASGAKGTKKAAAPETARSAGARAAATAEAEAEAGPDPAEEAARRAELEAKAAAEMEALRAAAWRAQLEAERRREAERRKAREEEAARRKEEASLRKALLEAAYDGDDDGLRAGLQRAAAAGLLGPDPAETADGHGNTLLSEAAAGGSASTVQMLLKLGVDPNSRGEFGRTPLWRAAFLGKAEVVPLLLEGGADPRIGNEGGELPVHVAPPELKETLGAWDTAATDRMAAQIEARRAERAGAAAAQRQAAVRGAEEGVSGAEASHERAQSQLKCARMELEKRIHEYDICVEERKPEGLTQVALDQVHAAEAVVAEARAHAAEAAEALDAARLALRRQQQEAAAAGDGEDGEAPPPGVPVAIKALHDVLVRDVGGLIAASGRWPLVLDSSGQASVFLRYQDTNYVNALSSAHMAPPRLRRSLLGGLRYGKPLVLDLQDCDLWPEMPAAFDRVQPGLLAALLDRSLLSGERYTSLIRPEEDGDEYEPSRFSEGRLRAFSFVVLCSAARPNPALLEAMYVLRVVLSG